MTMSASDQTEDVRSGLEITTDADGIVQGVRRVTNRDTRIINLPRPEPTRKYAAQLAVNAIRVDEYQRTIQEGRVSRLKAAYYGTAIGVIYVSKREDGTYWVIDGQHRLRLLKDMGKGDTLVDCMIYEGLTREQEATLFLYFNEAQKIGIRDRIRARVEAGEREALELLANIAAAGYYVQGIKKSPPDGRRQVEAVGTAEWLYRQSSGRVVQETLSLISATWGLDRDATKRDAILGVGQFVRNAADVGVPINHRHFLAVLRKYALYSLIQNGKARAGGKSAWGVGMMRALVEKYNLSLGNIPEMVVDGDRPRQKKAHARRSAAG